MKRRSSGGARVASTTARDQKAEYGDFQTPMALAQKVCALVKREYGQVDTVLEPTCGVGHMLVAAQEVFGAQCWGVEKNKSYVDEARRALASSEGRVRGEILHQDMFEVDWSEMLEGLTGRVLVVGNPPWVTNAQLGVLGSENLPPKRTQHKDAAGLMAKLGASNFDVSEWLLQRLLGALPQGGVLALLVKTSVARKALQKAWDQGSWPGASRIYRIDAMAWFGVSVDACLLCVEATGAQEMSCEVYETLDARRPRGVLGVSEGLLIADLQIWPRVSHLRAGPKGGARWRSGIKHDCARVLELRPSDEGLRNGYGELVDVESEYLYPLVKSSDLAKGRGDQGKRLIITQTRVGAPTSCLQSQAPRLWRYLSAHAPQLDRRKSSVYRGKPRFSVFGVGDYSFAPWKIAVSGLHPQLRFGLLGPVQEQAVLFDDTTYFLSFDREYDAQRALDQLNAPEVRDFFRALMFEDAKRPVTARLLGALRWPIPDSSCTP